MCSHLIQTRCQHTSVFFCVLYHFSFHILGDSDTKKINIWRCHIGLWEIVMSIFHHFLTKQLVNRPVFKLLHIHILSAMKQFKTHFAWQVQQVECLQGAEWALSASLLASDDRQQWVRLQTGLCNLYGKWLFSQVDYITQWPQKARCVIISTQSSNSQHGLHAVLRLSWCVSSSL